MTAFMEKIYKYDSIISYRLCDFRYCRWFSALMVISSKLGDGLIWFFLSLCLILLGGMTGVKAVFVEILSAVICIAIFKKIKNSTTRKRPFETYPDMEFILPPPDEYSFPSGHSMNAFAAATVMACYFPFLFLPLFIIAVLIATSRVFLALHYPTDVIIGALIGVSVSLSLIWILGNV
jgi:undecaprenyl-diphosphatase